LAQIVLPEATLPNRREPRPATSSRMIWRPTVGASSTMSARSFSVESLPDTPASRPASSPGRAPATGRRSSGRRRVEVSGGVRPPPACAGIGTGQIFVARPGVSASVAFPAFRDLGYSRSRGIGGPARFAMSARRRLISSSTRSRIGERCWRANSMPGAEGFRVTSLVVVARSICDV